MTLTKKDDESKEENQVVTIPEEFLSDFKKIIEDLKSLQTDDLNRYKSAILKEMHEIRQWSY